MSDELTGVSVHTEFFPLMFLLYFFKPAIKLDGEETALVWGSNFVEASPGTHEVEVFYKYLFGPASLAKMTIEVPEGGQVELKYWAPPWIFLAGTLTQK